MSRGLWLGFGVLAVMMVSAGAAWAVAVVEEDAPNVKPLPAGPNAAPDGVQALPTTKERPAREPRGAAVVKKQLSSAQEAIDAAAKALEEGKKDEALAQLKKAKEAVAEAQKAMQPATAKKAVNAKCPIMGNAVDAKTETREFQGKVVGFCCPACPPAWDKLSDEEKAEKLKKAME